MFEVISQSYVITFTIFTEYYDIQIRLIENKLLICALGNLHYQMSREKFEPEPVLWFLESQYKITKHFCINNIVNRYCMFTLWIYLLSEWLAAVIWGLLNSLEKMKRTITVNTFYGILLTWSVLTAVLTWLSGPGIVWCKATSDTLLSLSSWTSYSYVKENEILFLDTSVMLYLLFESSSIIPRIGHITHTASFLLLPIYLNVL